MLQEINITHKTLECASSFERLYGLYRYATEHDELALINIYLFRWKRELFGKDKE